MSQDCEPRHENKLSLRVSRSVRHPVPRAKILIFTTNEESPRAR